MSIGYTDCPYCDKETEIDYEGESESSSFERMCQKCSKIFAVCYQTDISFTTAKLAVLTDKGGKEK